MKKIKALWQGSLIRGIEFLLDIFVMIFSLFTVIQLHHFLTYKTIPSWNQIAGVYWYDFSLFAGVLIIATACFFKLYQTSLVNNSYRNAIKNTFMALIFMNIPLIIFAFYLQYTGQVYFFGSPWYSFIVVFVELVIYAIYKYLFYRFLARVDQQYALIVGYKEEVDRLAMKFLISKDRSKSIKYLYYIDANHPIDESIYPLIDEVDKVYMTQKLDRQTQEFILNYASFKNYKEVIIVPEKTDIFLLGSKFDNVDDTMVLRSQNMHLSIEMRIVKRAIDLVVSILGLTIAFIPMVIVALIVKLQDGGPIFYKQERFKRHNRPFYILKFRSMTHKQTKEQEQTLATRNDNRITKFGKFIRATRLDELPQLINVFKGEMTLVGPRPFMKSVVDEATKDNPDFMFRSNVKPGITGLSHVFGRYDTTPEERLRYDLLYVRKCSLWLDLKILFLTVVVIFNKEAGLGRDGVLSFEELLEIKKQKIVSIESNKHCIKKIEIVRSEG